MLTKEPEPGLGRNIARLRRRAGMTQKQVVDRLKERGVHISKSTYAKIETNRANIKVSELVALKAIFQAEYAEFFKGLSLPAPKDDDGAPV